MALPFLPAVGHFTKDHSKLYSLKLHCIPETLLTFPCPTPRNHGERREDGKEIERNLFPHLTLLQEDGDALTHLWTMRTSCVEEASCRLVWQAPGQWQPCPVCCSCQLTPGRKWILRTYPEVPHTLGKLAATASCMGSGGQKPPKDIHIQIPKTCDYVALHGKRDFADRIKLKILKWREEPGLSVSALCNHKDMASL